MLKFEQVYPQREEERCGYLTQQYSLNRFGSFGTVDRAITPHLQFLTKYEKRNGTFVKIHLHWCKILPCFLSGSDSQNFYRHFDKGKTTSFWTEETEHGIQMTDEDCHGLARTARDY